MRPTDRQTDISGYREVSLPTIETVTKSSEKEFFIAPVKVTVAAGPEFKNPPDLGFGCEEEVKGMKEGERGRKRRKRIRARKEIGFTVNI